MPFKAVTLFAISFTLIASHFNIVFTAKAEADDLSSCIGRYTSSIDYEFIQKYGCVRIDDCLVKDRSQGPSPLGEELQPWRKKNDTLVCFSKIINRNGKLTYTYFDTHKTDFHKSIASPPYIQTKTVYTVDQSTLWAGKTTDCVGDKDFYISRGFINGKYEDIIFGQYMEVQICKAVVGGIPSPLTIKENPFHPWPKVRGQRPSIQEGSQLSAPTKPTPPVIASNTSTARPQLYETLSDTPFYFRIK